MSRGHFNLGLGQLSFLTYDFNSILSNIGSFESYSDVFKQISFRLLIDVAFCSILLHNNKTLILMNMVDRNKNLLVI